ncbi:MAG: aminoacyl-tRNA hydrolase [Burkholderiales bacterium]|nr:aminoacyl-tRNA hydrolase [Burkholderiales bacterium]
MSGIRILVGLGNPGKQYERTRHNAGFWFVERLALARGVALKKDNHYQALMGRDGALWLVMPQTFMNASGRAVQMLAGFFKVSPEEILVVHDELDFAPGTARLKHGGGIAGHNGLRDISQRLGSHDYWRLRIGVGRPGPGRDGADYVLEKPPAEEREAIEGAIARALELVPQMLEGDLQGAMHKLHTQDKPVEKKAEEKKPESKKKAEEKTPEPKKAKKSQAPPPPPPPKEEKAPLLKGLLKSLTGSKK